MEYVLGLVLLFCFAFVVVRVAGWARRNLSGAVSGQKTDDEQRPPDELSKAREAADALQEEYGWADPERLPLDKRFKDEVERLAQQEVDVDAVLRLSRDTNVYVACMALAALAERDDVPPEWTDSAVRALRRVPNEVEPFVYGALVKHAAYPVVGPTLAQLDEGISWQFLAGFIRDRRARGELVSVETFRGQVPIRLVPTIESLIDSFEDELGEGFRSAFEEWRGTTVDLDFLTQFARVWERPFDEPPTLLVGRRRELVELMLDSLSLKPPRSVLLVGEHGTGRTAVTRTALQRLDGAPVVFEATAAQVQAGAIYVGELEGRIKEIADKLKGHRAIWVLPDLEETVYAGQHMRSPKGMLDALLPHVEAGELALVAEVTPAALERLQSERPQVSSAFDVLRVRALDMDDAVAVAQHALASDVLNVSTSDQVLVESFELAEQFLPNTAAPGNLLRLVKSTAAEVAEAGRTSFDTTDVLGTLAASLGLPLTILDPQAALELDEVRSYFNARVLNQPEAVECIVERIAMIKAGLVDPTRPLGVFLFVGPTGTGKTEIAKALAEFLFGSQQRLVRLDMSEYQTPESLDRLLSDSSVEPQAAALISSVRKDPFAVVLLDEFEKAAGPIWDVFLQVFDDGRLTDRQGRTVDFRHAVIILTSNLGATRIGGRLGFVPGGTAFRADEVQKAVDSAFRREFLNRIDRVVVFRPFERVQMRALLDKELSDAMARRGLRGRPWAIEIDDSAYEFIIEQGFSPELGARPLKRAIDRHLLAPLAAAIVGKAVPEGEQFLFVSAPAGTKIEVEFIDPDADEPAAPDRAEIDEHDGGHSLDLRSLALAPRSDDRASAFVLDELRRLSGAIRGQELQGRKQDALQAMNAPGFWEDESRFETLGEAEYIDRLQAALSTAESLGERLARSVKTNGGAGPRDLVALLASRLYVLDSAVRGIYDGAATDVFVRVRASDGSADRAAEFVQLLSTMYAGWAERRGMRIQQLSAEPTEHVLAVSGLGSGTILTGESGLHVLERGEERQNGGRTVERVTAAVSVAAWQAGPSVSSEQLLRQAQAGLAAASPANAVVRRYGVEPAPLVRDAVRGYRTGRLDRVLAGDFDLF